MERSRDQSSRVDIGARTVDTIVGPPSSDGAPRYRVAKP
jgi:hypothetical protein